MVCSVILSTCFMKFRTVKCIISKGITKKKNCQIPLLLQSCSLNIFFAPAILPEAVIKRLINMNSSKIIKIHSFLAVKTHFSEDKGK